MFRPISRVAQGLIAIFGIFIALSAWAFASPVGASPDEDFHLVSIWCANGGMTGTCESTNTSSLRLVAPGLIESACFGRKPEVSATCQSENDIFNSHTLVASDRGNFNGGYPGGFFSVMRMFATPDIQFSVVVMRLFNALLFCAILAFLAVFSTRKVTQVALVSAAITLVPLGLFVIASVNPSSWAITAMFAVFFGTIEMFSSSGRRKYLFGVLALFGVALAAAARYDALAYALLAVAVSAWISSQMRINRKFLLISLAAVALVGIVFVSLGGIHLVQALVNSAGTTGHQDSSPIAVLFFNIAMLPELFAGFSGQNGLGWLDTEMPFSTWLVAAVLLWGVLFSRLRYIGRRTSIAAGVVASILVIEPLVVLQLSNATVGQNVQARYLFPLLLLLVFALLANPIDSDLVFTTVQKGIVVAGLILSQALAIFFNMSRYITGGKFPTSANLNDAALHGWWWSAGPSPIMVFVLATLGFATFLWFTFFPGQGFKLDRQTVATRLDG